MPGMNLELNGNPPVHTLDQFVVIPNLGVEIGLSANLPFKGIFRL